MKKIILPLIVIASILFTSCDPELERVVIQHEPLLNILANLSPNYNEMNYVHVFRTTATGEPNYYELSDSIIYHEFYNESSEDTIRYETFYIDTSYAVNDANVYYILGEDTITFYEYIQGIYLPTDTNFTIQTGGEYNLIVETSDFGTAVSYETAIAPVSWLEDSTIVLSLSNFTDSSYYDSVAAPAEGTYPDSLRWTDTGTQYSLILSASWTDVGYYFSETFPLENPVWDYDSTGYNDLFNPDPFLRALKNGYYDRDTWEWHSLDTLSVWATVITYSQSYLDYQKLQTYSFLSGFIRYPSASDFRINIDNSLGAFVSSSKSESRLIHIVR